MYLEYQRYSSLQDNYNLTIAQIRAFLLIAERLRSFPRTNISRECIAKILGFSVRHIDSILKVLKEKGLLSWSHRPKMYNDFNHYVITPSGKIWMPYFKNTYKVRTGIFKRAMLSIALLLCPSPSSFSLLREDYIYNPPVECKLLKRARARKAKMTMPSTSKELKDAQELMSLSKWGVIRLTAYPVKAIAHAISSFRSSKSKKDDPFKWFCKVAEEWCMDNNTEPDWEGARQLARSEGIPKNPEWIEARKPMPIPGVKKPWKPKVVESRAPKSEEEVFLSKIQVLDRFKQMGELNEFQRIVQANLMKQIDPFMEK
jgi:hypothetical protein